MIQIHSPFPLHWCRPHPVIPLGHPHGRVRILGTLHIVSRIFLSCTQWQATYCRSTALSCDFSKCLPEITIMPLTDYWKWPKLMMSNKRKQRVEGKGGANANVVLVKAVEGITSNFSCFWGCNEKVPELFQLLCLFCPPFGSTLWCSHSQVELFITIKLMFRYKN